MQTESKPLGQDQLEPDLLKFIDLFLIPTLLARYVEAQIGEAA